MDISPTSTAATGGVKTPEPETETPSRIQPGKPLSFTNGVLKRHHHHHPPPKVITYKECLKNHAASLGVHAVDGCGEFMTSPNATPTDPTSLKCAACGCHRNFHRRDPEEQPLPPPTPLIEYRPHHRHHPPPPALHGGGDISPNSPSPPPISSSYAPHMLLALSSGGLSGPQPKNNPSLNAMAGNSNGRKRFRSKFTADQKEKMHKFSEKIRWKFQKRDEDQISDFCNEVGVERNVLKVWMHNNKALFGRKEINNSNGTANDSNNIGLHATGDHHHNHNDSSVVSSHVVATNGSP